ncbi:MAG: alpha/beta hydrolase [Phycisphaerae bacterium]|nr:alpha/beta hydrolase [Gemmatimonadaceae bacterium]
MWTSNSPTWHFDEATFISSAAALDNPDCVDVVIHSYRHRLGQAAGYAMYDDIERRLAALPIISVPCITMDGGADGVVAATDGKSTAAKFTGMRQHVVVPNAGHNLPQENPGAFANAVWKFASKRS